MDRNPYWTTAGDNGFVSMKILALDSEGHITEKFASHKGLEIGDKLFKWEFVFDGLSCELRALLWHLHYQKCQIEYSARGERETERKCKQMVGGQLQWACR
jgi:hypothetical protein